ncbi:MAG: ribonuclease P protein component [Candidatus Falkowbacteria bacterium]
MLEKKNRICLDKEFDRVFKTGQSFYGKVLGLKAATNDQKYSRFGLMVSLKVSKKAVIRNKIKRQLRAIIEKELPLLKEGKDVVIIVFPLILEKNFSEIREFLKMAMTRLKLYK